MYVLTESYDEQFAKLTSECSTLKQDNLQLHQTHEKLSKEQVTLELLCMGNLLKNKPVLLK